MADATYFVSVLASAAGANKRHLCVWNGAGSGKTLRILSVQASGAPAAAVTGLVIPLYVTAITTAPTGGGALTPMVADGGAGLPAQVTCMGAATGGAAEATSAFGCGTVSGEETSAGAVAVLYAYDLVGGLPVTLPEGRGIVVKQGALASAGAINVVVQVSAR